MAISNQNGWPLCIDFTLAYLPSRRLYWPKTKKVEDISSTTVSDFGSLRRRELKTIPKPKHYGTGNQKSSSAKVLHLNFYTQKIIENCLLCKNIYKYQMTNS